jgi:hypothetical protein
MNRFKILSIICTVMIFVCFFGFAFAGYMMVSSQDSLVWVIICFVGFPVFGILANVFKKLSENQLSFGRVLPKALRRGLIPFRKT